MYKKKKGLIVVVSCWLFGFIFGMEERTCGEIQLRSNDLKKSLQNGSVFSWEVNDYIVPVFTLWQALKREVFLPGKCLIKMKNMQYEIIEFVNKSNRKQLRQDNITIHTIDVSEQRKNRSNEIRGFYSKLIEITYQDSLEKKNVVTVCMETTNMLCEPSSDDLKWLYLLPKSITTTMSTSSLKKMFEKKGLWAIELKSSGNISDWIRVANYCKSSDEFKKLIIFDEAS